MPRIALLVLLAVGCGGSAASRSKPATTQPWPAPEIRQTQTTEITSARVPTGVDPHRLRTQIEGRMVDLVDRCGELQVETDRYATDLHLEIDPTGTVSMADARGANTRLDACIAEVARFMDVRSRGRAHGDGRAARARATLTRFDARSR